MKKLMICIIYTVLLSAIIACSSRNRKTENIPYTKAAYTETYSVTGSVYTNRYAGTVHSIDSQKIDTLDIDYELTISRNEYTTDGKYILIARYTDENTGRKTSQTSRGYMSTLREVTDDWNTIVYKLTDEIDDSNMYFMVVPNNKLRLLNNLSEVRDKENANFYEISLIE